MGASILAQFGTLGVGQEVRHQSVCLHTESYPSSTLVTILAQEENSP